MTLKDVDLRVETLRCEANEAEVVDELLAHDGVQHAVVDFANELVRVRYDEAVVPRSRLVEALGFFGLTVESERALAAPA